MQLSRPTEDMVPEPGEPKTRRGSQLRRAESNGASWHAATSASQALSQADTATPESSAGGSLGGLGGDGGRARASEWLKEHKKKRSFIHIPSRSVDLGNGSGDGGGPTMEEIFGESSERTSRGSTGVALATGGSGSSREGGDGGGGRKKEKHRRNASASEAGMRSSLGLNNGGGGGSPAASTPEGGEGGSEEEEELVGADSAGNGGVVVKKSHAEKLEKMGDHEDQPDRMPADEKAKEDADAGKPKKEEGGKEKGRESGGGGKAAAASSLPNGGAGAPSSPTDGVNSVSVETGERDTASDEASFPGEGEQGEWKTSEEGEDDDDSEAEGNAQVTPKGSKKAPPGVASSPGSKRRLVTEVIGDGDDVDVTRPQDMDEGEVSY